jgi:hypothetical protein
VAAPTPGRAPAPAARPVARPVIAPAPAGTMTPAVVPTQPAKDEPPRSTDRPAMLAEGAGEGRPPGFRSGAPAGYWIWQGPRGGWRLRTTTANVQHVFRGHIRGMTGAISNVHPTRTEFRDRIWKTNDGWAFSFKTEGHADGFTFVTRDEGCVLFDLQLDGGPEPKRVTLGKAQVAPATGHFIVCPRGAPKPR